MSAIDLSRLNQQISELVILISEPDKFLIKFHDILERYNNWALRKNPYVSPHTLLRSYEVPKQIIQQIKLSLLPLTEKAPLDSLVLIDKLWLDSFIESRELACEILGILPISVSSQVIERILSWASPQIDKAALDFLLTKAISKLHAEAPNEWDGIVFFWLSHLNYDYQNIGLQAINKVVKDPLFSRIPQIFKLIRPFIQHPQDQFLVNLSSVIEILALRSPIETAYFLKEILADTQGEEVEILIRRYSNFFSEEIKETIKVALRSHISNRKLVF